MGLKERVRSTHYLARGVSRFLQRQQPVEVRSCALTTPPPQPAVKGMAGQVLTDLSQIKKLRRAEGVRAGERSIKQLSGSKVHWPLTPGKKGS